MIFGSFVNKWRERLVILKKIMIIAEVKPVEIVVPVVLSTVVVGFSGISLGLLIPLSQSIFDSGNTPTNIPVIQTITSVLHRFFGDNNESQRWLVLATIGLIIAAQILKLAVNYLNQVFLDNAKRRYNITIRRKLLSQYLTFGQLYFDRNSYSHVQSIFESVGTIGYLIDRLRDFFTVNLRILVHIGLLAYISVSLTALMLLAYPILHFYHTIIEKAIWRLAHENHRIGLKTHRAIFNTINCLSVVKTTGRQQKIMQEFNTNLDEWAQVNRQENAISQIVPVLNESVRLLILIALFAAITYFYVDQPGDFSVFIIYLYIANAILPELSIYNRTADSFASSSARIEDLLKIFSREDKHIVTGGHKQLTQFTTAIELKDLHFAYQSEVPVLRGVDCTVQRGETVAIVGPTGAGKSTLMHLLLRLYDCPEKSIYLDGSDIRDYDLQSLYRHMSFVSQEAILFNDSIRFNIQFALDEPLTDKELDEITKQAQLYDFVQNLPQKYDTEIGDRGIRLSGGEKQRLSIARALARKTEILLLDEATSSLDSDTERRIQQAIEAATSNTTAIIIAHRLSTIAHADKIIVLQHGKVVESGTFKELVDQNGIFANLKKQQEFY